MMETQSPAPPAAEAPAPAPAPPAATSACASSTIQCAYCTTQLSYPKNSVYIQCPKCKNTMNPQAPHINYMHCVGCQTLLSHPPSSLTIQCPKCLVIMELPAVRSLVPTPSAANPNLAKKQRKKRKDPNAPKRASNAYMIFCKERRARLKEERPDLPFGQLGAKLGEMWRDLTNEEKKPYENQASADRDRYKKAMHSYSTGLLSQADLDLEDEGDGDAGGEGDCGAGKGAGSQGDTKRAKLEGREEKSGCVGGVLAGNQEESHSGAGHASEAGSQGLLSLALQMGNASKIKEEEEGDEGDEEDDEEEDEGDEDEDDD